jgi:two-component sensor histidine kinase
VSETVIKPKIHVENTTLNVDTVIPCALIINELVSNSLKHAFPDNQPSRREPGEIYVNLRHGLGNKLILIVGDNGIGMPAGFDIQKSETLGLRLVSVLAGQLKGTIELNNHRGTEFAITFEAVK